CVCPVVSAPPGSVTQSDGTFSGPFTPRRAVTRRQEGRRYLGGPGCSRLRKMGWRDRSSPPEHCGAGTGGRGAADAGVMGTPERPRGARGVPDLQERPEVPQMRHADADVVARLRAGDETAFATLLERHSAAMLRVASMHLPRAAAEEVVQDTWLAVVE